MNRNKLIAPAVALLTCASVAGVATAHPNPNKHHVHAVNTPCGASAGQAVYQTLFAGKVNGGTVGIYQQDLYTFRFIGGPGVPSWTELNISAKQFYNSLAAVACAAP